MGGRRDNTNYKVGQVVFGRVIVAILTSLGNVKNYKVRCITCGGEYAMNGRSLFAERPCRKCAVKNHSIRTYKKIQEQNHYDRAKGY